MTLRVAELIAAVLALAACTQLRTEGAGERDGSVDDASMPDGLDASEAGVPADGADDDASEPIPSLDHAALAEPGAACESELAKACVGHDSVDKLVCTGSPRVWTFGGSCDGASRCESRLGPTQGTCQPIAEPCLTRDPGDFFCEGSVRRACGVDRLHAQAADCAPMAECEVDGPIARCRCSTGYEDDGAGGCREIDECADDACGAGATSCTDGLATRVCTCAPGFTGSGSDACIELDECADDACGPGASACEDGTNVRTCTCAEGYSGTGTAQCNDIDECAESDLCPVSYPCVELEPGAYACSGQFADWPMPDSSASAATAPSYMIGTDTVIDDVTKLEWQRHLPNAYVGCSGGSEIVGDSCTRDEATAYCAQLGVAGDGWRLPSKIELESILDVGRIEPPTIDPEAFPSTHQFSFWASSPDASSTTVGWAISFFYGTTNRVSIDEFQRVRCVR